MAVVCFNTIKTLAYIQPTKLFSVLFIFRQALEMKIKWN